MRNFKFGLLGLGLVVAVTVPANAAFLDWDGGGDGVSWTDGVNWVGNPATVPANDYGADFRFGNVAASPTTITRSISTSINDLTFMTAGWTISGGSYANSGVIKSYGAGTNTITGTLNQKDGGSWDVGVGNTLVINAYYQRSNNINKIGEGILNFTSQIGGFSGSLPTWGIHVMDGLVRIEAATPYTPSAGTIYISSETGRLQLKTTNEAAVQAMFGTRIYDEVGSGLGTRVIDNTYVEVYSIPEPASLALLACGLGMIGLRRGRE